MEILLFDFSAATTEPPTSSQVRFDAATYADVANVWCRNLTSDGIDVHAFLSAFPVRSTIYVQDKNDHTLYARFELIAPPVDKTTYVEWPVVFVSGGGAALFNNQAVAVLVATPADSDTTAPGQDTGATVITVATVKAHLQRPDLDDNDPDLLQKMAAAQAAIMHYIGSSSTHWADVVAGWLLDPTTVPLDVQHAVLLKVSQLWAFRGDEFGGVLNSAPLDDASDMPPEIVRLLRRWRDPVLA